MKYLYIPWDRDYQGAEDVLIAIKNLKNRRGLKINIQPKYFWFLFDNNDDQWPPK